jgi:hypothetical protein
MTHQDVLDSLEAKRAAEPHRERKAIEAAAAKLVEFLQPDNLAEAIRDRAWVKADGEVVVTALVGHMDSSMVKSAIYLIPKDVLEAAGEPRADSLSYGHAWFAWK